MSFESVCEKVENVIAKLGIDPVEARTENTGQWNIAKDKSLQLMMDVWDENGYLFFQILSFVCPVEDHTRPDFFKLLLQENHGFCETSFTILDNNVFLKYTTEADTADEERIFKSITRIAYYNEVFRQKLG